MTPTPHGVAQRSKSLEFFTGVSCNGFFIAPSFPAEHYAVPSVVMFKQSRYTSKPEREAWANP